MGQHIIIKIIKMKNKPIKEPYICAKDPLIINLILFIHENVWVIQAGASRAAEVSLFLLQSSS